jgi:hypothetical protein
VAVLARSSKICGRERGEVGHGSIRGCEVGEARQLPGRSLGREGVFTSDNTD